ncbi:hypothetical protein, variant [Plasmodium yoelii 17X]|uniref:Uncharacterized protein n=3 Tax=Plasmodium yoelii TaxID=5861 RepID=A0AAF0B4A6_PLAYO|nr:conserved Plasmodium protein, unknown function [Plasmodium yoelii]ETB60057.1 hypothetical protein, variant [Plasmodium yoelii 17X]WBY56924.1 hypothetical protein Py17XNL_000801918 [Plasmodium yoelii yoelii]CDU17721.1 conserved Plasmodium protein, unknown function [Plasmodium yoelii]VTZ77722.1 conserved Plasmodium protein, unknown function [Plasmodium yoelii]|eukprot:XP_022812044.1 conserved Plasmodium protein, unknown function [Plasmodium yoelii]
MMLKKLYNGHFRRVSLSDPNETSASSKKSIDESSNEDKKCENKEYGIVNNIIYGAGLGVGAIGFSLAVLSSTIIASTLVFSLYFCANTCNISDEELFEECI